MVNRRRYGIPFSIVLATAGACGNASRPDPAAAAPSDEKVEQRTSALTVSTQHQRSAWTAKGTSAATGTTLAGPIDATANNRTCRVIDFPPIQ